MGSARSMRPSRSPTGPTGSRVLARLIGILGDFDLAEDALQDAWVAALASWPTTGIPDNPGGWLVTTARRKAVDRLRSAAASDRRQRAWGELSITWDLGDGSEPDPRRPAAG